MYNNCCANSKAMPKWHSYMCVINKLCYFCDIFLSFKFHSFVISVFLALLLLVVIVVVLIDDNNILVKLH